MAVPDSRRAHRPFLHSCLKVPDLEARPQAAAAAWDLGPLCKAYAWPSGLRGGGVIALVELGGGWTASDTAAFCRRNGIPEPAVTDISVDGTTNAPGKDAGADMEVALDIQVAAAAYALATGGAAAIRVYWARDIEPAVRAALADHCDVCSISWGADEAEWGAARGKAMEAAAAEAAQAGMAIFAAAGDNDSSDGGPTPANVDLPASCPHVVGCGGTSRAAGSETVWNNSPGNADGQGTGGGYSTLFKPLPSWELGAPSGPGRMVPDVAANADPETGYNIVAKGRVTPVGGTSAVAPLYAGLFAAFGKGPGWVAPRLWQNPACFNDITQGDNGAYRAGPGPDPCTGLGSPIGTRLAELYLRSVAK